MRILKSFKYAVRGIIYTIRNERNMRIHSVVSLCVIFLSFFFNLSPEKYCILGLTISFVVVTEVINSALESLMDLCAKDYNSTVKSAKDMAAGAVLIASIVAFIVGVILFSDVEGYKKLGDFCIRYPWVIFPISICVVMGYFYIFLGPTEVKNRMKLKFKNIANKLNIKRFNGR
ncbi:MAG: diacylglycerol kinase family protein [Acutalibacteraceae bacterium]